MLELLQLMRGVGKMFYNTERIALYMNKTQPPQPGLKRLKQKNYMKAITIKQPFASLIVEGIKDIENRTWKTNLRGRVLIHASASKTP